MPPFSGVPVHIILHALSLLVVVGYNVSLWGTKISSLQRQTSLYLHIYPTTC